MKKIVSILFIILVGFVTNLIAEDNQSIKRISEGEEGAKITIIAYESLTCGHCADFHKNVYPSLKKDFIDKGLVRIEFRHFPLDIAAFNASKIGQCNNDGKSDIMHILYSGQKKWARGKTPEEATKYLKKFLEDEGVTLDFEKCLADKAIEDYIMVSINLVDNQTLMDDQELRKVIIKSSRRIVMELIDKKPEITVLINRLMSV